MAHRLAFIDACSHPQTSCSVYKSCLDPSRIEVAPVVTEMVSSPWCKLMGETGRNAAELVGWFVS